MTRTLRVLRLTSGIRFASPTCELILSLFLKHTHTHAHKSLPPALQAALQMCVRLELN